MPLIRLKKATPGNIVLIDFSSKHEIGKSSEKRVNPLGQIVGRVISFFLRHSGLWWSFSIIGVRTQQVLQKLDKVDVF